MKRILLFLTIVFVAFATNAQSIIRVNNNAGIAADYTTLQAAHDAATAGDIIYLEFSPTSYGGCTFTKQLTVIGTGYFLTENPMTPQQKAPATTGDLTLNAGSEGTIITGLTINRIYIAASNIVLRRNRITSFVYIAYNVNISNCIIEQNYIHYSLTDYSNSTNSIINNNIINRGVYMNSGSSATFTNNIVNMQDSEGGTDDCEFYNSTVQNNIFYRHTAYTTNTELRNNIFAAAGTDVDGNQYNIDMGTVFLGTGSTDGQWQLSASSPALGAAIDGGECGAFGGPNPYRLSGLPAVPYIYEAIIPTNGSATNGLPVQIKIRSNN